MRFSRIVAMVSAAAAMIGAFVLHVPAVAAAASPGAVPIAGTASPEAASSPSVGSVPAGNTIAFEVELKLPDQQSAEDFADAVSTPGSPSYGQYLTPAAWEQRFSPTTGEVAEVTSFLRQSGFQDLSTSADRMEIDASGTASQIEQAFGTSLSYHTVQGVKLLLVDKDLSVPAGIASIVAGVTGITETPTSPDTTNTATASPLTSPDYGPQPPGFRVAPPCASYYGQKVDTTLPPYGHGYPSPAPWAVCGYTPPQFRSAYGVTSGPDGAGVTVAIVDA